MMRTTLLQEIQEEIQGLSGNDLKSSLQTLKDEKRLNDLIEDIIDENEEEIFPDEDEKNDTTQFIDKCDPYCVRKALEENDSFLLWVLTHGKEGQQCIKELLRSTYNTAKKVTDALINENVFNLFIANKVSITTLRKLSSLVISALKTEGVSQLVSNGKLPIEKLKALPNHIIYALLEKDVLKLVFKNKLPLEEVPNLTVVASHALLYANIRKLFELEFLTLPQLNRLSGEAYDTLKYKDISDLVLKKELTIQQVLKVTENAGNVLKTEEALKLVKDGIFKTFEQLLGLPDNALYALGNSSFCLLMRPSRIRVKSSRKFIESPPILKPEDLKRITNRVTAQILQIPLVRTLIANRERTGFTFEEILKLGQGALKALLNPDIRKLVSKKKWTIKQFQNLTLPQGEALGDPDILHLVLEETNGFTLDKILQFPDAALDVLGIDDVLKMVEKEQLTLQDFQNMTPSQSRVFKNAQVCQLMCEKKLFFDDLKKLTDSQIQVLWHFDGSDLIKYGILSLRDLKQLQVYQSGALQNPRVRWLVRGGILSAVKLKASSEGEIQALIESLEPLHDDTYYLLCDAIQQGGGDKTLEELTEIFITPYAIPINNDDDLPINNDRGFNGPQSIHTASVHRSASQSAVKLNARYRLIRGDSEELVSRTLAELEQWIRKLCEETNKSSENQHTIEKYRVAERCIPRISKNHFADPATGITLRQLLALVFTAIQDKPLIEELGLDPKGLIDNFIEILCHLQREYNPNPYYSMNLVKEPDSPACQEGSFAKLVSALWGWHPDCDLKFMTKTTGSYRLPCAVKEAGKEFLEKEAANLKDLQSCKEFFNLLKRLKEEENVETIWESIKEDVAKKMKNDGFDIVFGNEFLEVINSGCIASLEKENLDKQLKECQQLLKLFNDVQQTAEKHLEERVAALEGPQGQQEFIRLLEEVRKQGVKAIEQPIKEKLADQLEQKHFSTLYPDPKSFTHFINNAVLRMQLDSSSLDNLENKAEQFKEEEKQQFYEARNRLLKKMEQVLTIPQPHPPEEPKKSGSTNKKVQLVEEQQSEKKSLEKIQNQLVTKSKSLSNINHFHNPFYKPKPLTKNNRWDLPDNSAKGDNTIKPKP